MQNQNLDIVSIGEGRQQQMSSDVALVSVRCRWATLFLEPSPQNETPLSRCLVYDLERHLILTE